MHMPDFHDFENAVLGNGPTPTPGIVSFTVRWAAAGDVADFDNPEQQYRGDMRVAAAQMDFTARSGIYDYISDPLDSSAADFAQLGTESNGSFF
jgi:hypothetical protein